MDPSPTPYPLLKSTSSSSLPQAPPPSCRRRVARRVLSMRSIIFVSVILYCMLVTIRMQIEIWNASVVASSGCSPSSVPAPRGTAPSVAAMSVAVAGSDASKLFAKRKRFIRYTVVSFKAQRLSAKTKAAVKVTNSAVGANEAPDTKEDIKTTIKEAPKRIGEQKKGKDTAKPNKDRDAGKAGNQAKAVDSKKHRKKSKK